MIVINDKKYDNVLSKVEYGEYEVTIDGVKEKAASSIIKFNIGDKIFIRIETRVPKEIIEFLKIDNFYNFYGKVTDIGYEDEDGWISLIDNEYTCYIVMISDKKFNFKLEVEDKFEDIKLLIDENIKLL